jgi:hypothetical protein
VTVDAVPLGDALDRDRRGRPLPVWQGCRRIADGDIFLMNPRPRQPGRRYFGPIPARTVIGKATPLYTDEAAMAASSGAPATPLTASHRRERCSPMVFQRHRQGNHHAQIGTFTRRRRLHRTSDDAHAGAILIVRPSRPMPRTRRTIAFISSMARPESAEIGAGWKRTGERAGEYIAVLIDDPALPQPIRANLFRDDDAGKAWSLHWSRPAKRDGRTDAMRSTASFSFPASRSLALNPCRRSPIPSRPLGQRRAILTPITSRKRRSASASGGMDQAVLRAKAMAIRAPSRPRARWA